MSCSRPDCPVGAPCVDVKAREYHFFKQAEVQLRKEIRRYDLRHREETLINLLLELTFGLGLRTVRVHKLDVFVDFTGISRANITRTLQSLHGMRMLDVEEKDGIPVYRINTNTNEWMCRIRVTREASRRAMETVKAFNGLEHADTTLIHALEKVTEKETSPNFRGGPDDLLLQFGVADLAMIAGSGEPAKPLPNLE